MNKHNYKAGVILASLLSCCPIANAHPQQVTMIGRGSYNQQNYEQNVAKKSSNGNMLGNLILGGSFLGGMVKAGQILSNGESFLSGKETTGLVDIDSEYVNTNELGTSSSDSYHGDDDESSTACSTDYPDCESIVDGDPEKYCYQNLNYSIDELPNRVKYNISMKLIGNSDLTYEKAENWPANMATFNKAIKDIKTNTDVAFQLYAFIYSNCTLIYDSERSESFEEQCRKAYADCSKKYNCAVCIPDKVSKWFQPTFNTSSSSCTDPLSIDQLTQKLNNGDFCFPGIGFVKPVESVS